MDNKNVPKKYMMILQKIFGGQEALEFFDDGSVKTYSIKPFSDYKYQMPTKKESIVKKNTMAFYDAITNKFPSLDMMLTTLGRDLYGCNYKSSKSYIGYLDKGYMKCLQLSFGDPLLAEIARNADGNNINNRHRPTMDIVMDFINLIEDEKSDFVEKLRYVYNNPDDKSFYFSKSFIDDIQNYRYAQLAYKKKSLMGYRQDDSLVEDLDVFKRNFLTKVKSYKNFRELYRFRKQYLYNKEQEKINIEKEEEPTFAEQYSEVRQKEYPKQKVKTYEVPGQLSLFDMIDKK
jgi:hypothetical protein